MNDRRTRVYKRTWQGVQDLYHKQADKTYTITFNGHIYADLQRFAADLRDTEKLVKVPMTSVATAAQISNAMGLAACTLEGILWWIDENNIGPQEAEVEDTRKEHGDAKPA